MKVTKLSIISVLVLGVAAYSSSSLAINTASSTAGQTTTSKALSFDQIKMAAQSGDADAQYALGYMYYYGKSGATKDTVEAKKWIMKSAAQKQPQAEKALALMNKQQGNQPVTTQATPNTAATPSTEQKYQEQPKPVSATNEANRKGFAQRTLNSNKESDLQEKIASESNDKMILVEARKQKQSQDQNIKQNDNENTASAQSKSSDEHKSLIKEATREAARERPAHAERLDGNFTLQLLGSYHRDLVAKELKSKHLDGKAKIYQTTFNNKDWFVLLYGRYDNKSEANEAKKSLESQFDFKPWVKPTATIKTYKKLSD